MQILGPHPRPSESENLAVDPRILCFNEPASDRHTAKFQELLSVLGYIPFSFKITILLLLLLFLRCFKESKYLFTFYWIIRRWNINQSLLRESWGAPILLASFLSVPLRGSNTTWTWVAPQSSLPTLCQICLSFVFPERKRNIKLITSYLRGDIC